MTTWEEFAAAEPEFARRVRELFAQRKHATIATLRVDGSPRISGTEVEFGDDGGLFIGGWVTRKSLGWRWSWRTRARTSSGWTCRKSY